MTAAESSGDRRIPLAVALPPADDELLVMIGRLCDGVLSRADCARLESLMWRSSQAIDVYCAVLELNAALQWRWHKSRRTNREATVDQPAEIGSPTQTRHIGQHDPAAPPRFAAATRVAKPSDPRQPWAWSEWLGGMGVALDRPLPRFLVVIGVLLTAVFVGGAIEFWSSGSLGGWAFQPRRLPGSVACVTGLHNVVWAKPEDGAEAELRRESSLFADQRVDLVRGLAEITFDGGATTLIEGPATFEVVSLAAGRLYAGQLTAMLDKTVAKAAGAASRFTIETPTATVTDLGTSFGVAVGAAGETSVSVFDGLVELLPRLEGGAADAKPSRPLRLAAGESAGVATDLTAKRGAGGNRVAFTRAIPQPQTTSSTPPLPFAWDDQRSVTLVREPFAGAGSLAGSTPASRGGVGDAAWVAPGGWRLDAAAEGLAASSLGAALLPFTPEPGHRYRLSATIEIVDGGFGWASLGFAASADPRQPTIALAWKPGSSESPIEPKRQKPPAPAAPTGGDRLQGIQTRTLILDTASPRWRLVSLAGETLVGERVYETPPAGISHVGVSVFSNTAAIVRGFSLESVRVVP